MGSIPLPALDLKPVQQPDMMGDVSKLMAMRQMMGNQQIQQQEIQKNQQALADQQATTAAFKNWDPKTQSYDDLAKSVIANNGSANAAMAVTKHGLEVQQAVQTLSESQLKTFKTRHEAVGDALEGLVDPKVVPDEQLHTAAAQKVGELAQSGIIDPQTYQQSMQLIQSTADPTQLRQKIDQVAKVSMGMQQVAAQQKTQAETAQANAKAGLDTAQTWLETNKANIIKAYQQNPQQLLSQIDAIAPPGGPNGALNARTKSQVNFALGNGDVDGAKAALKQAAEQVGAVEKDIQVARQTQPLKIETAVAEGKARQFVEGMEKPVYAIDPRTGQKSLMSATDALQAGIRTMMPVGAKEVSDDTQLINRLGDVHQKISEYEQNLSKLGTTVSSADQGNIAALIGKGTIKLGAFGTELSTDRLNAALQRENISGLSDDAKKLLVSYYNARESMQGYQRVLSGTGRANEKAMELNLDALPNPATSDRTYAAESLKQFKQNLQIVGQGLPKIPGIKSPEEFEQQQTAKPSVAAPQVGQPVTIKGKQMKVTAVHPDGSFDAQ